MTLDDDIKKKNWREATNRYRERHPEKVTEYRERHKELSRDYALRRDYGISTEDFWEMLHNQGAKCAICHDELVPGRRTHVDHDHKTGVVRGLLCKGCNTGLGHFTDEVYKLESALQYLKRGTN